MSQILELRIWKKINSKTLESKIQLFWFKRIQKNEFYFYEEKDFLSLWFIHLTINYEENRTIISTHSSWLRYFYDIEQQNNIIRQLKKIYGWYLYNDWEKWVYIKWWEHTKLNVLERSCGLAYHKYYWLLMRALGISQNLKETANEDLWYITKMMPENNISLLNIPFLVSWLEDFLKTFFIRYVNYSKSYSKNKEIKIDRKLSLDELEKVYNNEITIWDLISEKYNFQNLNSVISAYREYCDLDFNNVLNKKRKIKSWKFYNLYNELKHVIYIRHKIIHEAEYIFISKAKILDYIYIFFLIWEEIVNYYEKKYNYRLDLNKI